MRSSWMASSGCALVMCVLGCGASEQHAAPAPSAPTTLSNLPDRLSRTKGAIEGGVPGATREDAPICARFDVKASIESGARHIRYELRVRRAAGGDIEFQVFPREMDPAPHAASPASYPSELAKIVSMRGTARQSESAGILDVVLAAEPMRTELLLEQAFETDAPDALLHLALPGGLPRPGEGWAWEKDEPKQTRPIFIQGEPTSLVAERRPARTLRWRGITPARKAAGIEVKIDWTSSAPKQTWAGATLEGWDDIGTDEGRYGADGFVETLRTTWASTITYAVAGQRRVEKIQDERSITRIGSCP
ncbi:hypothetical protein [Polyangium mundeleinium]|uniref:Uncharacterized protein n=1 Tax=Polyangium mundeleinium TaxID=2995306 RepID=A0ABT5EYI0_9BACT|nr:hypothetical protein [Polyangium mundeleinium]MDC0745977.1 hypothetical protein [Polyangium mundeleinium]